MNTIEAINSYVEYMRLFMNFHKPKLYLHADNEDIVRFNRDYILANKLSATYQRQFIESQEVGTQYTETSLTKVFQKAKVKAGIKKPCTLHTLRHCYATHLLESGTDIRYIQELSGHKHTKTTEIYTHVTTKSIQKIKSPFDDLEV